MTQGCANSIFISNVSFRFHCQVHDLSVSGSPGVGLIIKIHPAKLNGLVLAKDPITKYIAVRFKKLPVNIILIEPDVEVSSYKLIDKCQLGIVFASKAGIEIATIGKPIIVTAESWVCGQGFSNGSGTKE